MQPKDKPKIKWDNEYKITPEEVLSVYHDIEMCHDMSEEVKNIEKKLLINSLCNKNINYILKNKSIYDYFYKTLINIGNISNDPQLVNIVFERLYIVMDTIFNLDQYTLEEKIGIFYAITMKYNEICNQYNNKNNLNELKDNLLNLNITIVGITPELSEEEYKNTYSKKQKVLEKKSS